jgi:effector-binding domain-containing protein
MLTLPRIETRAAQHYVAVHRRVIIPFGDVPGPAFEEVETYLKGLGITDFGPDVFKYTLIDMPRLEVDIGFVTPHKVPGTDAIASGEIPAGRYATTLYTGPYENLMDVNAVLIGWARQTGLVWDSVDTADGEKFASRVEFYFDPPTKDPKTLRTEVAIKIRD